MTERPEFPELMPPEAPHVQSVMPPGWWVLPVVVFGAFAWAALLLLL
ncbi:hypothetical protein [Albidovulum sp.]